MLANNARIDWFARAYSRRTVWQLSGIQCRLGIVARAVLGNAVADLVCNQTGQMEAIASFAEVLEKPGVAGLDVWNRRSKIPRPARRLEGAQTVHRRHHLSVSLSSRWPNVPGLEVIDCWYDSGAMPFAQWGYPHRGASEFADQFPAAFISEASTNAWLVLQSGRHSTCCLEKPIRPLEQRFRTLIRLRTASSWV